MYVFNYIVYIILYFCKHCPEDFLRNVCFFFQSKTYDSVTDKFMDFSFEKTNSAYMLFYELCPPPNQRGSDSGQQEEAQVILIYNYIKNNIFCNI